MTDQPTPQKQPHILTTILDAKNHVGETVVLQGWIDTKRDHGKITFVDLRDRTAKVQCVGYQKLSDVTPESVVEITGLIKQRPEKLINPNLPTGTIEVDVQDYTILNVCKELPMPLDSEGLEINEEVRLKYRYLDLRRTRLQSNMKLRSDYMYALREDLHAKNFTEIETPMLTKSTKEGSRDFVVPSRLNPGKFYALPQSPQQYKQLLMTAGIERYFQFARCIRDEDLRADRGFEHTQLDLELSFVTKQQIMQIVEEIVITSVTKVGGKIKQAPFPIVSYDEAMKKYGSDKFDLRTPEEKSSGLLAFAWVVDFPFFKQVDKADAAEVADGKSGWTFTHNPFSMPEPEHLAWHMAGEHVSEIKTQQYDLVCNGFEVGGGSVRAHRADILRATYKIMGYTDAETEASVGHMLEAFGFGTPPHGGIALGVDRFAMLLSNEESLREVIAFPMNSHGKTAVMDAPAELEPEQLKELGIAVSGKK